MRVSCIIPTRNRPEMTCRAVASVIGQEAISEVIVVDDGSTDHTPSLVGQRFPEVRLARLAGLGPGPARNAGAALAGGEVLMFLDSDDLWLPGHSSALLRTMARGYAVAYGATRNLDQLSGEEFLVPEDGQAVEGATLDALSRWCFLMTSSMAVSREAFIASGGFGQGMLGEDWVFHIRLARHFHFGYVGPEPISLRHLHAGSLCSQAHGEQIAASLAAVAEALAEAGAGQEQQQRFAAMLEWTRQGEQEWQSIQQWYSALKEEGLV